MRIRWRNDGRRLAAAEGLVGGGIVVVARASDDPALENRADTGRQQLLNYMGGHLAAAIAQALFESDSDSTAPLSSTKEEDTL